MLSACLSLCLFLPQGEAAWSQGLESFRAGNFAKAAEAFEKAVAARPEDPALRFNLAQSLWRAGQGDAAEVAADAAAVAAKGAFDARRAGLVGNIRLAEARALHAEQPTEDEQIEHTRRTLASAARAADLFQQAYLGMQRGEPGDAAAVLRNLQRTRELEDLLRERLRHLEEEKKRREEEEQRKQEQEDQQSEKDQQDPSKRQDESKPEGDPQDPQQQQKQQQTQEGGEPPEEKQAQLTQQSGEEEETESDPPPSDPDPARPEQAQSRPPVPGEYDPDKQLSPEQARRLMAALKKAEERLERLRKLRWQHRPKVKKDW